MNIKFYNFSLKILNYTIFSREISTFLTSSISSQGSAQMTLTCLPAKADLTDLHRFNSNLNLIEQKSFR